MLIGKIAVPAEDDKGLAGKRSDHFGHSRYFTLVDMDKGTVVGVKTLVNLNHQPGGCGSVVRLLQENNVSTVVASGMGNGPYTKLSKTGIRVIFADRKSYPDVHSVIQGLQSGSLLPFTPDQLCKGSGNCHQHGTTASKLTS